MAKTRDILGHVQVEVAERRRKCHHSRGEHSIPQDTAHLTVKGGSFGARKNYCPECARQILDLAKSRLDDMERALNGAGSNHAS